MRNLAKLSAIICAIWISSEVLAQAGAVTRVIREVVPLDQMARRVFRVISDYVEPTKVRVTSDGAVNTLRSVIRPGVTAIAAAANSSNASTQPSAPKTASLHINTSVPGSDIKIMNIGPRYHDGIKLTPKNYEIMVSRPEYRTKRFWVNIPPEATGTKIEMDVELQKLGLPDCKNNVTLSTNGSAVSRGGMASQTQARFPNTDINDLYLSYAEHTDNAKFLEVINATVNPSYVEMTIRQPSHLTISDIESNRPIDIDDKRYTIHRVVFEAIGLDTLLTAQTFTPPGIFLASYNKETVCEYAFIF